MVITFYTFSKKLNSTAIPSSGTSFDCYLKDPSSIISPTVILDHSNPTSYNYAKIDEFDRYYWISNWEYNRGVWEATLSSDALASFRSSIGSTQMYALRSSVVYNGDVQDPMYAIESTPTTESITKATPYAQSLSSGSYVVTIIGRNSSAIGGLTHYVLSHSNFVSLLTYMFDENVNYITTDTIDNAVFELSPGLTKALFNPSQYIATCIWFPFDVPGGSSNSIYFGYWNSGVSGQVLSSSAVWTDIMDFTTGGHPQAATRGSYLNGSPYTRLILSFPPFGTIPLPANQFISGAGHTVHAYLHVDCINGQGTLELVGSNLGVIARVSGQIGVPISLSSVTASWATAGVADLVDWFADITNSDALSDFASGPLRMLGADVSTSGSQGGFGAFSQSPTLTALYYGIVDENNEDVGRPAMQKVTPSTTGTGYYRIAHADVKAPATSQELSAIKRTLEGGFFYE